MELWYLGVGRPGIFANIHQITSGALAPLYIFSPLAVACREEAKEGLAFSGEDQKF